ncbi:MAG: DUF1572 family protein [Ignavibacteriaceae bacterium]
MNNVKASVGQEYIDAIKNDFERYKTLGDKTFAQLEDKDFFFKPDDGSNSIAILIQHISGNIISRMSDFLTSDGEKPTRNRDDEFDEKPKTKKEFMAIWEAGWKVAFDTLNSLNEDDLLKSITIRNELHSVIDALNRYDTHYAYHVGQIVMLGKMIKKAEWNTLSIPKKK